MCRLTGAPIVRKHQSVTFVSATLCDILHPMCGFLVFAFFAECLLGMWQVTTLEGREGYFDYPRAIESSNSIASCTKAPFIYSHF